MSEEFTVLFDMDSCINNSPDPRERTNNKSSEDLTRIHNIIQQQQLMLEQIISKVDRITTELISIRSEVSTIKAKVCGEIYKTKEILPMQPFKTMPEIKAFDQKLETDEQVFKNFVKELLSTGEKSFDKFIRSCWRLIFTDQVAKQCSWRGTNTKMCVRGMYITLGIRTAFKQKFALEDADFDKISQKFFQYAQDRIRKVEIYKSKNKTDCENDTSEIFGA